jgi:hypothetical protein
MYQFKGVGSGSALILLYIQKMKQVLADNVKGTVARDFLSQVFFMELLTIGPRFQD